MIITDENTPDKIIRLVEYLTSLAKINAKIIRSLDDYHKILWIHKIPKETKHCFVQAWGKNDEYDEDVWIEVTKIPEPELPKIPEKCNKWVNRETLRNTKDLPELYEKIYIERTEKDPDTGEKFTITDTLLLADNPEIRQAWEGYLENYWLPWTEVYNRYAGVQEIYADLFHIYQELQKLGEQYELVYCQGLLIWKTPGGHEIKRHIIVSKASLEIEPHLGRFTVKQAIDEDQADIELDMLDVQDQPQNVRPLIEEGRKSIGGNLFDKANMERNSGVKSFVD